MLLLRVVVLYDPRAVLYVRGATDELPPREELVAKLPNLEPELEPPKAEPERVEPPEERLVLICPEPTLEMKSRWLLDKV